MRAAAAAQALVEANNLALGIRHAAPRDDGTLAASVRIEQGRAGDRFYVKAGGPTTTRPVREGASATYDYALGQEFGTAKMPANPFFYPIYRYRRRAIRESISRAALNAARRFNEQGQE
ncbi:MAG: hypothetical protein DI527_01025 [Chelatococcus sp.]|nr:MAG: hypothetical protein DI527_01025 [Chelatococcus sp.]